MASESPERPLKSDLPSHTGFLLCQWGLQKPVGITHHFRNLCHHSREILSPGLRACRVTPGKWYKWRKWHGDDKKPSVSNLGFLVVRLLRERRKRERKGGKRWAEQRLCCDLLLPKRRKKVNLQLWTSFDSTACPKSTGANKNQPNELGSSARPTSLSLGMWSLGPQGLHPDSNVHP